MNKILSIVVGGVLVVALVVVGILYGPKLIKKEDTSQTIVPLQQGLGDLPDSPDIGPDLGPLSEGEAETPAVPEGVPDFPFGEEEPGAAVPVPVGEGERSLAPQVTTEGPQDAASVPAVTPREQRTPTGTGATRPAAGAASTGPRVTRPAAGTTATETAPAGTAPTGAQPTEILPVAGPAILGAETPTPPTTGTTPPVVATSTPATTTPPEPGNYTVRTLEPVPESKMSAVRKAMSALGVTLREQKTQIQNPQAYRVAVGYFRTKAEAESWAQYYFKPHSIDYRAYQVQGMYSLQVGVYSQMQNADTAMRDLYKKFPGWRLPVRREITSISLTAYRLSLSQISKSLADQVWRELIRLDIQAEISGV